MAETIVLDAPGIAVNRSALDITSYVSANSGIDFGDAEIAAYMAEQQVGSSPVDYRLPNRQIKIPLNLRTFGAVTFSTIRGELQAKAGLFQREGGWIMRQVGSTPLYADVVNATLHLGGSWLQAYRDIDVDAVLSLECLPDWYGDEIVLSNHSETTLPHLFFVEASVLGNYPGRVRVVATDNQGVDQHGLLWGFRSRNYSAGTTAALFYEAEALVPVNGAAGTALAGASGGTAVVLSSPPTNVWVSMLSMSMVSGTVPLTHTGSYRVWARCYSGSATPQFQLLWGVGSLSVPKTNDPVQLPGSGAFYLLDLGEARLDAPPVGPAQWFGAIQAQAVNTGDSAAVDCVYLQPLDDGAGKLTYTNSTPPASSINVSNFAGTAVDDAATGTVSWTNPGAATAADGVGTVAILGTTATSHYLKVSNFGFSIPSTATIKGIAATIQRYYNGAPVRDTSVQLMKASVVQTTNRSDTAALWPPSYAAKAYGSSTDLWGTTWAPSDINSSGFGLALVVNGSSSSVAHVDYITLTVYYALAAGFTVAPDAVIAASKTLELRTEGAFRQGGGGTVYAPVSQVVGDLPRIPPSGLEARPVQTFLKASRGNFDTEPDSGIDDISARITFRPSYLYTSP